MSYDYKRQKQKNSRSRSRSRSENVDYKRIVKSRSRTPRYNKTRSSRSETRSKSRSPKRYRREPRRVFTPSPQRNKYKDSPDPCKCIGVFGLNVYTKEEELRDVFSRYGPIEHISVILDAKTGRSRGYCFIYFQYLEDAKVAKEQCNGMMIEDRKIRVDYSITKKAHTPTPGYYMGIPPRDRHSHYSSHDYERKRSRRSGSRSSSKRRRHRHRTRSPSRSCSRSPRIRRRR